jgi:endonuclease YncB( thermonuclease family)
MNRPTLETYHQNGELCMLKQSILLVMMLLLISACDLMISVEDAGGNNTGGTGTTGTGSGNNTGGNPTGGEVGQVTNVVDGDTIDVMIDGEEVRVRYVGVNTPERDEVCYSEAVDANRRLVQGQTVTLVRDTSETDRYGRLLRYIYVGNTFVNQVLVEQGYAEAVLYDPDDQYFNAFSRLEQAAANAGLGCHPTGIFADESTTR